MAKKTIRLPGGQLKEGEVVRPKAVEEPWCVYELTDGTTLRMKLLVTEIVRLDGEYTPDGDPVYVVRSSNVLTTEAPDELRKRPAGADSESAGSKSGNYL